MAKQIKHSLCFWCKPRCRLRVEVEDDRLVRIQGSPIKACPRKYCSDHERFYHSDRLTYPLKRVGEKGQNQWQRITWDEALGSWPLQTLQCKVYKVQTFCGQSAPPIPG